MNNTIKNNLIVREIKVSKVKSHKNKPKIFIIKIKPKLLLIEWLLRIEIQGIKRIHLSKTIRTKP